MQRVLMRFGRLVLSLVGRSGSAVRRFPWPVLGLSSLSLVTNLSAANALAMDDATLTRLSLALGVGVAGGLSAALLAESRNWRPGVRQATAAVTALALALLVWLEAFASLSAPILLVGLVLSIPLAPFLGRGNGAGFWSFTAWTVTGAILAFVSVFVFVLGLHAIFAMASYLFGFSYRPSAFEHIYITAGTLIGPLFTLGRIPARFDLKPLGEGRDPAFMGLRTLFDFVVIPLTLVMAVMLHLYAVRILVTGELPKNQVGWIVLSFMSLVLGARISADPFLDTSAIAGRLFKRLWALVLIVPLALLGYALTLRIASDGFTIERYFVALAGVAVAAILVLQLWRRPSQDIRVLAGIPVALLLLASAGPWGAASVTVRSQTSRILAALQPSQPDALPLLSSHQKLELRSRLRVLDDLDGMEAVLDVVPETVRLAYRGTSPTDRLDALYGALGLDDFDTRILDGEASPIRTEPSRSLPTGGFDRMFIALSLVNNGANSDGDGVLSITLRQNSLVLRAGDISDTFSLADALSRISTPPNGEQPGRGVLDLVGAGGRQVRLAVTQLQWSSDGSDVEHVEGVLLFHSSQWR